MDASLSVLGQNLHRLLRWCGGGITMSFHYGTIGQDLWKKWGTLRGLCGYGNYCVSRSDFSAYVIWYESCTPRAYASDDCCGACTTLVFGFYLNSWMQPQQGLRCVMVLRFPDWFAIIFNPSFPIVLFICCWFQFSIF